MARILILLLALAGPALAHSWYPYECCSEKDCFPVEARDVREVRGGWELQDGTFIPYREARPSPDGKFHVCRHSNGQGALMTAERLGGKAQGVVH